ncbi:MAG: DGQHR domain-containing protein [Flavobacteriaceae bacterium]|nr:DGQHR domain-containing protein [Flavobacteriaceae bacterium]
MKIPAIKAKIGTWTYYITTLTFQQINDHVEKIDDQLHNSESLQDLIQRSITKNYLSIKDYILNQPEMFFNSLVLAVYDGTPSWIEVELKYGEQEYFNMGFLDFPEENEKMFPVDGQHRVEGIKSALLDNPDLRNNSVGAIFIGHSTDEAGMQKSRRLFTTLNRYAKPVTMDDIIALDEDDSIAIITRDLLENFDLFTGKNVTKSKNKAIPDSDKKSITSIITLYQCNKELLKLYRVIRKREAPNVSRDKKKLEDYLKFRPKEEEISLFNDYCKNFWLAFADGTSDVNLYLQSEEETPALDFRNKETGGNLIFRPVGILPFVQAVIEINKRKGTSFEDIFARFDRMNFNMNIIPWRQVLWNPYENIMIMGSSAVVKLLLLYMYQEDVIRVGELRSLKEKYAAKINYDENNENPVLYNVPIL